VIIWINGAFGAGKTTLAEELHRRLPEAMPFDPEYVGYLLTRWVPAADSGDFQDLPLWRRLTAEFAIGMSAEYGLPLIVPMTLANHGYREEIFGLVSQAGIPVLHVFLDVPADELRRRIDAQVIHENDPEQDAQARAFRHRSVERCVQARAGLPDETLVLRGDQHTPAELADLVLEAAAAGTSA
jgi:thymidylate kinase